MTLFMEALNRPLGTQYSLPIRSKDVNKKGFILYTEFVAATLEMHGRVEEKRLAEAFDHIDDDDSGFISREVSVIASCLWFTMLPLGETNSFLYHFDLRT